jgi:flagellar assembly protein FliH
MAKIIRAPIVSGQPPAFDRHDETPSVSLPDSESHAVAGQPDAVNPMNGAEPTELQQIHEALEQEQQRAQLAEQRIAELEEAIATRDMEEMQAGYEQGHAEGLAAALAENAEKIDAEVLSLQQVVTAAEAGMHASLEERIEDSVVEIVCAAVSKIVGEAATTASGAEAIIRQMLQEVDRRDSVSVHISPADHQFFTQSEKNSIQGLSASGLTLVADERVEYGGCLLETQAGELDGRVETQLKRFMDLMLKIRSQHNSGGVA